MPSVWEVFDTVTGGLWVLFVLALIIFVFTFIIGGYFAPLFKNEFYKDITVMTWVKNAPDRLWFAFKIVAASAIIGFFAYITFKMLYERETYPYGGGY